MEKHWSEESDGGSCYLIRYRLYSLNKMFESSGFPDIAWYTMSRVQIARLSVMKELTFSLGF